MEKSVANSLNSFTFVPNQFRDHIIAHNQYLKTLFKDNEYKNDEIKEELTSKDQQSEEKSVENNDVINKLERDIPSTDESFHKKSDF